MTQTTNIAELRQRAKLPANQAGGNSVAAFFESNKAAMASVLPKHVTPERMLKIALSAVRSNKMLLECTVESLMGATMQCAQLGLEPNTPLGHAYLIPFRNKKRGITEVQVLVGYRGLMELSRRSGQIVSLAAHAVHENDEFDFAYGLDERLTHRPAMGKRGDIIAFYAVAKLEGGGHAFEVVSRDEVDAIRDASQGYRMAKQYGRNDSPWIAHYSEMGRKTVIRRLFKYLPVSIELATAAAIDERADAGKPQNLDRVLEGDWTVGDDDDDNGPEGEPEAQVQQAQPRPEPQQQADKPRQAEPPKAREWPEEIIDHETGESTWVDSAGTWFDRDQHAWSRDNRPAVNQDGTFRARRGAAQTRAADNTPPQEDPPAPGDDDFGEME